MTAQLLLEAVRMAKARRLQSGLTLVIALTTCAVLLGATASSLQAERRVVGLIDEAGTRELVLTDTDGRAALTPQSVARIAALDEVEVVIGLGPPQDATNGALGGAGQRVPVRAWYGHLPGLPTNLGNPKLPPVALASPGALERAGMLEPVGWLSLVPGGDASVVGTFRPKETLPFLDGSFLLPGDPEGDGEVRSIHLRAKHPTHVAALERVVGSLAAPERSEALAVTASDDLARLREVVQGELGDIGRRLVLAVLGVSLFLVGLTTFTAVMARRHDLGRRRSLGATREGLVVLVVVGTVVPASVGAVFGAAVGAVLATRVADTLPDLSFVFAIATLTTLTSGLAAVPPAILAAFRDPVRELRIP